VSVAHVLTAGTTRRDDSSRRNEPMEPIDSAYINMLAHLQSRDIATGTRRRRLT
jgi:hypothetical protein